MADLTNFNRQAVKAALVDNIAAQVDSPTVKVSTFDPGPRDLKHEHIFVDSTVGAVDYPIVAAGLYPHDDRFTVVFFVHVYKAGAGATGDTAGQRCEELMNAINAAVHADIVLDGVDGVIDATIGSVDGPDAFAHLEGWAALASVSVDIHCRIVAS